MLEFAESEAGGLESIFLLTGSSDSNSHLEYLTHQDKAHLGHQIVKVQLVVSSGR